MYVPGTLVDTKNVIIDIGTGYYAEQVCLKLIYISWILYLFFFKDVPAAKEYFKRKVAFVTDQMEKIQQVGLEKSKIRDAVVEVIELKVQSQAAQS